MKILMLLQKEFPPDIRIEKEAKALQKAGFEVHLLCRNRYNKKDEVVHGIYVDRLRPKSSSAILNSLVNYPFFMNPFWIKKALEILTREKINFIHAHDLPMVPLGLIVSNGKIPVFYDMHENYPAAMNIWNQEKRFGKLFRTDFWAQKLDKYCWSKVNHIFVVVEEQKERLVNEGIHDNKITVVSNRVDVHDFLSIPIDHKIIKQYRDSFTILYAGSFSSDRGLEVPLMAMKTLPNIIPNIKLLLVGDGPYRKSLEHIAEKEQIAPYVEFVGWQPFHTIPSYIRAASLCIVPQPRNEFINTTVPHKLFQYMALKKPVLVSDAKPLKRWVQKLDAGEIFSSGDVEHFINSTLKIHKNPTNYYKLQDSELFDVLDWKHDAANLTSVYLKYVALAKGVVQ